MASRQKVDKVFAPCSCCRMVMDRKKIPAHKKAIAEKAKAEAEKAKAEAELMEKQIRNPTNESVTVAVSGEAIVQHHAEFVKVDDLEQETEGKALIVKVLDTSVVDQKKMSSFSGGRGGGGRIAECLVGDETGSILFTARNEQAELMKAGTTVIIHGAKIYMLNGVMRLGTGEWGCVEVSEPADFSVKVDNNLSEFSLSLS